MTSLIKYSEFQLYDEKIVKRKFEENYLRMLFEKHHKLKKEYVIEYIHKAQLTGANPSLGHIFLTERNTKMPDNSYQLVGVTLFSYHFLLAVLNQTGEYEGYRIETGPKVKFNPFNKKEEPELQSTVWIKRNGVEYQQTVWWSEYYQNTPIWNSKPYTMLEKCAFAGSARKACPEALSGMYLPEEMSQLEEEIDLKAQNDFIEVQAENAANKKDKVIEQAQTEDYEVKEKVLEALKILLGEMTKGTTPIEKTTVLRETCGVNKFDDLKSFDSTFLQSLLVKLKTLRNDSLEKLIGKSKITNEVISNSTELKKDVAESNGAHLSSPSAAGPKPKPKTVADATFTLQ